VSVQPFSQLQEEKNEQEINPPRVPETLGNLGHGCRWRGDSQRVRAGANTCPSPSTNYRAGSTDHRAGGTNYGTSSANRGATDRRTQTHGGGF
jgi:hypothetical protein